METIRRIVFGRDGDAANHLGRGWFPAERGFQWMVGEVSDLWLDRPVADDFIMSFDVFPLVCPPQRPVQRISIEVDGLVVYRAALTARTTCNIPIASAASHQSGRLHVTIRHPDAISPRELSGADDDRNLAVAVHELRLLRPPCVIVQSERTADPFSGALAMPAVARSSRPPSIVFVGNCQMGALASLIPQPTVPSGGAGGNLHPVVP